MTHMQLLQVLWDAFGKGEQRDLVFELIVELGYDVTDDVVNVPVDPTAPPLA